MSIKMYVYVACNKSTLKRISLTKCNLCNLGIYVFVLLLPVLPCRHSLTIPHKRSFYGYAAYILLIHLIDTLGAALLVGGSASGICFINLGSYLYFTTFAPVVYFTFLQGFFRVAQPTLLFSYKSQVSFRLAIRQLVVLSVYATATRCISLETTPGNLKTFVRM